MMRTIWRKEVAGLYSGIDAQTVAEEICGIGDSATPEQIVERAKDETSELHKCFEWDVEKAAKKYWIVQARQICRHLVVERTVNDGTNLPPVRTFNLTDKGHGYKPTEVIFRREDEYQKLLGAAMAELHAFRQKYQRLIELADVFAAIDAV